MNLVVHWMVTQMRYMKKYGNFWREKYLFTILAHGDRTWSPFFCVYDRIASHTVIEIYERIRTPYSLTLVVTCFLLVFYLWYRSMSANQKADYADLFCLFVNLLFILQSNSDVLLPSFHFVSFHGKTLHRKIQ